MISESKSLLKALGIPVIQAISDGEAQAAILASKGSVLPLHLKIMIHYYTVLLLL